MIFILLVNIRTEIQRVNIIIAILKGSVVIRGEWNVVVLIGLKINKEEIAVKRGRQIMVNSQEEIMTKVMRGRTKRGINGRVRI